MALLYQGFAGPFVGKVGPAVGYLWKGKPCVRAYQRDVRYPNTEFQQRQRDWFVGMVRFASKATVALKLGLWQKAAEAQMTEGNYFVMRNKQYFVREGSVVNVDYSNLQLATGPAADVWFKAPRFEEGETIVVDFEKNTMSFRASAEDKVYLYVYAPALESGYLAAPVARRSKSVQIRLPETWAGHEVHLYGFVVDRDGRPSNSTYIGVGRVNHYEDRGRYIPLNKNWKEFVEMANEVNAESRTRTERAHDAGLPTSDVRPATVSPSPVGDPPEVP